jgi:tetratricopeptide (TPR) repeat protein
LIYRLIFLVGCSLCLVACEKEQDTKGETIPPAAIFQKSQKPELVVAYLTNLLENQDGANLYYLRSKAYFNLRAYQKAQIDIETALNQVPGDVDYLLLSSQIKRQLGLYAEAMEDAKLVESSGITSAKLYQTIAELYFAMHEKKLGFLYIRKLEKAGIAKSERVYVDFMKRQFRSDSLGALQSVRLTEIQHPDLAHAYFSYQIGRISNLSFQKQILGELKKFPLDPYLMFSWGQFLVHMGQFGQAEKVFNQSIAWMPQQAQVRLSVARYYLDRNQFSLIDPLLSPIQSNALVARDVLYLKLLAALNRGEKSKSITLLDSIRKVYASDGRFSLLYDRLLGKKQDSVNSVPDSTQQIVP